MIIRGTNPTLTFSTSIPATLIDKLHIAFVQDGYMVLEKTQADCQFEENQVVLPLTEEDTLKFRQCEQRGYPMELQIRAEADGKKLATEVLYTSVGRILKEGKLDDIC